MSASGVRSSCAALPVNCRWAEKPSSSRAIMSLNDALQRASSAGTSSSSLVIVRLSGRTSSTCEAKSCSGRSARPLTKYASTPPANVTAAVMHQLVAPNASWAPPTMTVTSSPSPVFVGSNASGPSFWAPASANVEILSPIESM